MSAYHYLQAETMSTQPAPKAFNRCQNMSRIRTVQPKIIIHETRAGTTPADILERYLRIYSTKI